MKLPQILEDCRTEYEASLRGDVVNFRISEMVKEPNGCLVKGDNLEYMQYLLAREHMAGKVDLIYVDPPFFSRADYGNQIKIQSDQTKKDFKMKQKAYEDTWENGMEEYLRMLTSRFFVMRDLLCDQGCLWVHLDWHAVHYVKIILDEIFGQDHFVNEIIWNYKSGGVSKKRFARKHDTLLFYGKTSNYYFKPQQEKSYNRGYKPYRFKGVKEYEDTLGWHTLVNMKDVWQIDMVGRTSAERTGYATQKPEPLLERILESCSREGDLCVDFFGGSGTLAATANKMNRRWISCDKGNLAIVNQQKRLTKFGAQYVVYEAEKKGECASYDYQTGNIDIKMEVEPCNDSKMKLLSLELLSYAPESLIDIHVSEVSLSDIETLLKKEPLQLIDYWSVDTNYDGILFKPEQCFARDKDGIPVSYICKLGELGCVAIKILDVFGNQVFHVFSSFL